MPCIGKGAKSTYDVLRIGCQFDISSLWTLSSELLSDYMRIRNGSHASKSIILSLASIDLSAIVIDGGLGEPQLVPTNKI